MIARLTNRFDRWRTNRTLDNRISHSALGPPPNDTVSRSPARKTMMYFSRMKTTLILGICLIGMLFGVPNLFPAPAAWMPWRTVHLGLDLRGGSYLLLQVDMDAVIKERLNSLLDGVRQARRPGQIFYTTLQAEPDQHRILLRLRDATRIDAATAALKPLISTEG